MSPVMNYSPRQGCEGISGAGEAIFSRGGGLDPAAGETTSALSPPLATTGRRVSATQIGGDNSSQSIPPVTLPLLVYPSCRAATADDSCINRSSQRTIAR